MNIESITKKLLFGELILGALFVCFIISYTFFFFIHKKARQRRRQHLKDLILDLLEAKATYTFKAFKPFKRHVEDLINVLDYFDKRLSDSTWLAIKVSLTEHCLLPKARQWATSWRWVNRHRAARCFRLEAQACDQDLIIALTRDKRSLVAITAAFAAVKLGTPKAILEVLRSLAITKDLAKYPYRDALVRSEPEVFATIRDLLAGETAPLLRAAILDVLSTKIDKDLWPLIQDDIHSSYRETRLNAMKIVSHSPHEQSIPILVRALSDIDPEIRGVAAKGLGNLAATNAIPQLEFALQNDVYEVSMEAALALKQMRNEGRDVLAAQDAELNPRAYAIARYVLTLA